MIGCMNGGMDVLMDGCMNNCMYIGLWQGGRGSAKSAGGERVRRRTVSERRKCKLHDFVYVLCCMQSDLFELSLL